MSTHAASVGENVGSKQPVMWTIKAIFDVRIEFWVASHDKGEGSRAEY